MQKFKSKGFLITGLLLVTVLLFVSGSMAWAQYALQPGAAAFAWLQVSGYEGLQPLLPILIALIAVAVTLTIAVKFARVFLGALAALFGVWIITQTFGLALGRSTDLLAFADRALATATGVTGSGQAALVSSATVTFWPAVTLVLAIFVVLLGLLVVFFAGGWQAGGRRYEVQHRSAAASGGATSVDAASGGVVAGAQTDAGARRLKDDRISDWDSLSDGIDPSDDADSRA